MPNETFKTPTIGRIVHFYHNDFENTVTEYIRKTQQTFVAGIVTGVNASGGVNLQLFVDDQLEFPVYVTNIPHFSKNHDLWPFWDYPPIL